MKEGRKEIENISFIINNTRKKIKIILFFDSYMYMYMYTI